MNRLQSKALLKKYFKSHFIKFQKDYDNGVFRYTLLLEGYDNSPNKVLETCIWFYQENMEVRTYYTKMGSDLCKEYKENLSKLYRLLNYLNSTIWPTTNDGCGGTLYKPYCLYTPRFYITEDNCCDITMTYVVPYDFYEVAPLETEDFITVCCPSVLDALSPAIFALIIGKMDIQQAINYTKAITKERN